MPEHRDNIWYSHKCIARSTKAISCTYCYFTIITREKEWRQRLMSHTFLQYIWIQLSQDSSSGRCVWKKMVHIRLWAILFPLGHSTRLFMASLELMRKTAVYSTHHCGSGNWIGLYIFMEYNNPTATFYNQVILWKKYLYCEFIR